MKTEMGMENWRNDADRRNPIYSVRNLLIPLYSPQIPHGYGTDSKAGSSGLMSATIRVGHGTVFEPWKNKISLKCFPFLWQHIYLFDGSQFSTPCFSEKNSTKIKMSMEPFWVILTKVYSDKKLCVDTMYLKMSQGLCRDGNLISMFKSEVKLINIYGFDSCLTMSTVTVHYFKTNRFMLLQK